MKTAATACSILSAIALAAHAGAEERGLRLQAMAGWASPLEGPPGDFPGSKSEFKFGDLYNRRESLAASVGYTASRWVALMGEVERNRFAFNRDQRFFYWSHPSSRGSITDGRPATILSAGVSVKVMAPLKTPLFVPFFIAGGGLSRVSYAVTDHEEESVPRFVDPSGLLTSTRLITFSRTVASFSLGLGTDVAVDHRVSFSAEWRYHRPLTSRQEIGEDHIHSTSYYSTRAGLTFRLH